MSARPTGHVRTRRTASGLTVYSLRIRTNGRRLTIRLGTDEQGWTPARARHALEDTLAEIRAGVWRGPARGRASAGGHRRAGVGPSFHELASDWLEQRRLAVRASTHDDLRWRLTNHLLPFFARMPIDAIDEQAVAAFVAHKLADNERLRARAAAGTPVRDARGRRVDPLGNESINKLLATLAAILDTPEARRWRSGDNPARLPGLRLRAARPAGNHLESDELTSLLEAAACLDRRYGPADERAARARELRAGGATFAQIARELGRAVSTVHRLANRPAERVGAPMVRGTLIHTLALAGLRASEALALRRCDVDLRHGRLSVAAAKTAAGVRDVDIPPRLVEVLGVHLDRLAAREEEALLFPSARGSRRDRTNLARRVLAPAVAEANRQRRAAGLGRLPDRTTAQTLRRTYISLALEAGSSVPYVMAQVGHVDEHTTLAIYAQVMRRQERGEVMRGIDRLVAEDGRGRP